MKQQKKNKLVFGLLMAVAAIIYLWYYPLDRGSVSISVGLSDYLLIAQGQTVQCPADPCLFSQKTGNVELKIQKDGYFPETAKIKIRRFKTEALAFHLKKIPTLKQSPVAPTESVSAQEKPLPEGLDPKSLAAYAWNNEGAQLAFLDKNDEKVKIWANGTAKVVTPLKGIGGGFKFLWSPDSAQLVGIMGKELYFIDTQKASRKKTVLDFEPQNLLWVPEFNALVANNEAGKVFRVGVNEETPLALAVNLNHAVWDQNGKLVYFQVDGEANQTKIFAYDPAMDESAEVVSKYNFPLSKIIRGADGSIYFYNPDLENWSMLEY